MFDVFAGLGQMPDFGLLVGASRVAMIVLVPVIKGVIGHTHARHACDQQKEFRESCAIIQLLCPTHRLRVFR